MSVHEVLASRPARFAAVLYAAASLLCTRIPLLNYLGFEFAALVALLSAFVSGFLTIGAMKKLSRRPAGGNSSFGREEAARCIGSSAGVSVLLLSIPLVIMLGNALFVRNCSLPEGVTFFILLPVISALFGVALGFFTSVHCPLPRAAFLLACSLLLVYSAATGYFTPAIFSYNFLYGFFPGLTYDEVLPLSMTLILFRILTLFVAFLLVCMGMINVTDNELSGVTRRRGFPFVARLFAPGRKIITTTAVLLLGGCYAFRCELGFESTADFIKHTLGGEYRTGHFVLYYSPASFTEDEIRSVGAEHEFRLHEVLSAFQLPERGFFESFIYPSPEVKQRLIGAGNTDITKPWNDEIHLSKQSLDGSLKHELVHAAAAPFGLPVVRASLSTGLVEGLAMAVDGEWGNRTLHEYAAALIAAGIAPDIRDIMSLWGFAAHQSSVSYVMAGSFCRYLIDRFGIRKMLILYRTVDYPRVYGRSLEQLIQEWQGYLARMPRDNVDQDGIDVLFRRSSIFQKVCPRVLARRLIQAGGALARREYAIAESLYKQIYSQGGSIDAFAGYITSALHLGKFDVLTMALDSVILTDDHPARYLPLFIPIGDAYWSMGDSLKASALYDRVYQADLSEGYTEASAVRLLAIEEDPHGRRFLPLFLSNVSDSVRSKEIDSLLLRNPDDRILAYVGARAKMRMGKFESAINTLKRLDFSPYDEDLEAMRLRFLGQALFRIGRYEEARADFWISLNQVNTEIAREKVNTWIDRCEWMETHEF